MIPRHFLPSKMQCPRLPPLFYFRDPAVSKGLPEEIRRVLEESPTEQEREERSRRKPNNAPNSGEKREVAPKTE
jgi:hypothetical protein